MPQDHRSSKDIFPLAEAQRLRQEGQSIQDIAESINWSPAQTRRKLQAADSGEITFTDMPIETVDLTPPIPQPQVKTIAIADITVNTDAQMRVGAGLIEEDEYAESMSEGAIFPPITLFSDGTNHWVADGFQRIRAAQQIGYKEIAAEIRPGTLRDAIIFACGANDTHGARRKNMDKQKAVRTLLHDEEWARWSDRKIADVCKVSNTMVSQLRSKVTVNVDSDDLNTRRYVSKSGTVTTMDTSNIGRRATADHKPEHTPLLDNGVQRTPLISIDEPPSLDMFPPTPRTTAPDLRLLIDEAIAQLQHLGGAANVEGYTQYVDLMQTLNTLQELVGQAVGDA